MERIQYKVGRMHTVHCTAGIFAFECLTVFAYEFE